MILLKILTAFCFFLSIWLHSSMSYSQGAGYYFIGFNQKGPSVYSLSNPAEYLSERAILRRTLQNISIDSTDLPVNPSYVSQISAIGASVLTKSKWMNGVTAFVPADTILNQINALPFVNYWQKTKPAVVSKSGALIVSTGGSPAAAPKNVQTAFNYGNSYNQIAMLNGHILHNQGFTGLGKVIAVLDAGYYHVDQLPAFDSLWTNGQILGWKDFVAFDDSVFSDHTHGMNVLSLMGGNSPGNLVGTAPGASYWLLRSEDAATEYLIEEDNWVVAAEFADSVGADIINSSLGYCTFNDPTQNHTIFHLDGNTSRASQAGDLAVKKGMVCVVSAGNEGNSSWLRITIPSDGDSVLSIGAVDNLENYVSFSGKGPAADGQVKPDVSAQGAAAVIQSSSGGFGTGNGTSFSSPITAGMIACLWQANPSFSAWDIIQAVRASGDQFFDPDSLKGYGVPDFAQANLTLNGIHFNDFSKDNLVNVFPNPFRDSFRIDFYSLDSQKVTIEIFDMLGKKLYSRDVKTLPTSYNPIPVNELKKCKKGVYSVRITGKESVYERKIVKD